MDGDPSVLPDGSADGGFLTPSSPQTGEREPKDSP